MDLEANINYRSLEFKILKKLRVRKKITVKIFDRLCFGHLVCFAALMLAPTLTGGQVYATPLETSFGLYRITANSSTDVAAQIQGNLYNHVAANGLYNLGLTDDSYILFTFANDVGIQSSITEIYFNDGTLIDLHGIHNNLGGSTHFRERENPRNLPAGRSVTPPFRADFSADSRGNPQKGIDNSKDILGISFQLQEDLGYDDVINALVGGELLIGMHLRGFADGASDGFVSFRSPDGSTPSPIPEPVTMLLFGTGLVGVAGMARKRKNKQG